MTCIKIALMSLIVASMQPGEGRSVKLDSLKEVLRSLPAADRAEQVRDAVMGATYAAMEPDPAYARVYFGLRPLVRRPYLMGLAEFDVGPGRIAPVGQGDYLVLVPETGPQSREPFDQGLVCRLLDERYRIDGNIPKRVRIATYRIESGQSPGAPEASVRFACALDGSEFYTTGSRGYVQMPIGDAEAMRHFLAETDDLIGAWVKDGKLTLFGRKYPSSTYKRPYRRLDLDDVKVIRGAIGEGSASYLASEIGFSLDPWFEAKPVAEGIRKYIVSSGVPEGYGERLKSVAGKLDKAAAFTMPSSTLEDVTGLFTLAAEIRGDADRSAAESRGAGNGEKEKKAKLEEFIKRLNLSRLADFLDRLAQENQFAAARYEGGIGGTEVGMTLFYCDVMGKLFAWGQLEGKNPFGALPIESIPQVEGFTPYVKLDVAAFQRDEIKPLHGRLWWGPEPASFAHVGDKGEGRLIRFAPSSARFFFKIRLAQMAPEEDPNLLWAEFAQSWNKRYLAIADHEPEFHRLDSILKYAILFKWIKEFSEPGITAFLDGGPKPRHDLRFDGTDGWYAQSLRSGRVGVKVELGFKSIAGIKTEALAQSRSGPFQQAGKEFWMRGGVEGPSTKAVKEAEIKGSVPAGAPTKIIVTDKSPSSLGGAYEYRLFDGRAIKAGADGRTVDLLPREGTRPHAIGFQAGIEDIRAHSEIETLPDSLVIDTFLVGRKDRVAAGRLALGPKPDGSLQVAWSPGAYDQAHEAVSRVAEGRDMNGLGVAEVRYGRDGRRLYVKLAADRDNWLELAPGGGLELAPGGGGATGGGGGAGVGGGFAYGRPGDPSWFRGRFLTSAQVNNQVEDFASDRPRHVKLTAQEGTTISHESVWLKPPTKMSWTISDKGSTMELADSRPTVVGQPGGELIISSDLAGSLRGLKSQSFGQLAQSLRMEALGLKTNELALETSDGPLYLIRRDSGWEMTKAPAADSLLAIDGRGSGVLRAIRTAKLADNKMRVVGDVMILPERLDPVGRQGVVDAMKLFNGKPELVRYTQNQAFTYRDLNNLVTKLEAIREPARPSIVFEGDSVKFRLGEDHVLDLDSYVVAADSGGKIPIPKDWMEALRGRTTQIDLRGVNAQQAEHLAKSFRDVDRHIPGASVYYRVGKRDVEERLMEGLLEKNVEIYNEPASLNDLGDLGGLLKGWLSSRPKLPGFNRRVRLVLDEFDKEGKAMGNLLAQLDAEEGVDVDWIIKLCKKRTHKEFLEFAEKAIERGARSVTFADGTLDPRAVAVQSAHYQQHPGHWETPTEGLKRSSDEVRTLLAKCLEADDLGRALQDTFRGYSLDVPKLFMEDGKISRKLIEDTLKSLENQEDIWMLHVFRFEALGERKVVARQSRAAGPRAA